MYLDGSFEVPELNSIDTLAEQREARDERTRARMSKKLYHDDIVTRVMDDLLDPRTPLGEVAEMLFSAPIRDSYDYKAFLELRDGRRLGRAILTLVADASLYTYSDADLDGF